MFWWWAAVGLAAWPFLRVPLDDYLAPKTRRFAYGFCGPMEPAYPDWQYAIGDVAEDMGVTLYLTAPLLLLMLALALREHGPESHLRAARWAFVVVLLAEPLFRLEEVLTPSPLEECLGLRTDPDYLALALEHALSAPVAILVAGAVAIRACPTWSLLAALVAVLVGFAAVPVVADRVSQIYLGPALTADGTHRYTLLSSYARMTNWSDGSSGLYVLDLAKGDIVDSVTLPEKFGAYTAVAQGREPGHYLAAATSPRGRVSQIFRLTVDDKGAAMLREPVSPRLDGIVVALDVSPEGRVAYGRAVDKSDKYSYFTGVLAPDEEWPSETPHGLAWTSPTTLVLPYGTIGGGVMTPAGPSPSWKNSLDVTNGEPGKFPLDSQTSGGIALMLPDGRFLMEDNTVIGSPATIRVHQGVRAVATAFTAPNEKILSMSMDATGTALLVGLDNQTPYDEQPSDNDFQIVRLDLRPLLSSPDARGDLRLPSQVVWRGPQPPAALAW
ncbi:hypothetical protein Aph01nite_66850 [Acrocarpospora phusangensis]|uniref:Uncharacterized protein n=1 Tax=Acrocarpospora phusangensis TaxID=1070424 RepID=A0A919QLA4_9ACTN|nr:hypothetical protein [Acrocarpospora phusangensis]GIH28375.1 hypothetical protein Aph01nite_66850 [Acrocarpospora phusangensis]